MAFRITNDKSIRVYDGRGDHIRRHNTQQTPITISRHSEAFSDELTHLSRFFFSHFWHSSLLVESRCTSCSSRRQNCNFRSFVARKRKGPTRYWCQTGGKGDGAERDWEDEVYGWNYCSEITWYFLDLNSYINLGLSITAIYIFWDMEVTFHVRLPFFTISISNILQVQWTNLSKNPTFKVSNNLCTLPISFLQCRQTCGSHSSKGSSLDFCSRWVVQYVL